MKLNLGELNHPNRELEKIFQELYYRPNTLATRDAIRQRVYSWNDIQRINNGVNAVQLEVEFDDNGIIIVKYK